MMKFLEKFGKAKIRVEMSASLSLTKVAVDVED